MVPICHLSAYIKFYVTPAELGAKPGVSAILAQIKDLFDLVIAGWE